MGLTRDHQPEPALVTGTRERQEVRPLLDYLESAYLEFLLDEVRPDRLILHLLCPCRTPHVVVQRL